MMFYTAKGHTLTIDTVGVVEVAAEVEEPDGVVTRYDNPTSARADFYALTGVEV